MQTLYIDVYFLVNFTVDFLALYFSLAFSKVPSSIKRVLAAAIIASLVAVIAVLLPEIAILKLLVSGAGLILAVFVATFSVSLKRRARFLFAFLIFEALIGGAVSYVWGIFDKYLYDSISSSSGAPVNRKLLIFSVIVLISIGVFKMIVSFFSNIVSEGSVELEICCFDKKIKTEAFIDSGNLAIDPMDMQPVLFIKESLAKDLLPENIIDLRDPDTLDRNVRKRIRLIPVSRGGVTHVLTGVKADSVSVCEGEKSYPVSVTLAIDKEKGSYDGFFALISSGVVGNAKT